MPIKLKIPRGKNTAGDGRRDPVLRAALIGFVVLAASFVVVFSYFYVKSDRIMTHRFWGSVFANAAKIYATPPTVSVGEKTELKAIAAELRHAGYSDKSGESKMGSYHITGNTIEGQPGPGSYHNPEPAVIRVNGGKDESINGNSSQPDASGLGPEMITSLFEGYRRSERQEVNSNVRPQ